MDNTVRVLHVVTYMGRGGLETMIMNYYRHIDRTKVQFDFLVHRDFRADYDDEIEHLGGRIYHVARLVPWSKSYHHELEAFFEEHPEYKIIHVHQDCLSSVALRVAEQKRIPVRIAHSHSSSQDKNWKYFVKLFYKQLIPRYATQLFACGKKAGDWMFGGAPYRIVQNAVNTSVYLPSGARRQNSREMLQIDETCFLVGHVGRFSYPKNHSFLIKIFSELKKKDESTKLLLVGDGESRREIEKMVEEQGMKDSVIFMGIRKDVPDLMQAMDVFVLPSLYEGLPVTMVEAQASGLPCFISDKVPLDCKITDSVIQLALDKSPEEWAESILSMKNQKRKNNYDIIKKAGFDIEENANWLQSFYLDQWKAIT